MSYQTVKLDEENSALVIVDQTKLPLAFEYLTLTKLDETREALCQLKVRGAPAMGVAAALGAYVVSLRVDAHDYLSFARQFKEIKDSLGSSRPTAVNLFWALERMEQVVLNSSQSTVDEIKAMLHDEAVAIMREDIFACKAIGKHGLSLLQDGSGILTHCNAGQLAAVQYGTALAPVYLGHEQGYRFKMFVDETRPLLQGGRLTAFELQAQGIDTTLICDSAASLVMQKGWIQAVLVGSDRIAANGDACNKIGSSGLAILANHHEIPFYVCAPTSTIDMHTAHGGDIYIEERPEHEVTTTWYEHKMTPKGIKVYNPAFDVVSNNLISAIVTEKGLCLPPYRKSLADLF